MVHFKALLAVHSFCKPQNFGGQKTELHLQISIVETRMIRQVVKTGIFRIGDFIHYQSLPCTQVNRIAAPFLLLHHQTAKAVSAQTAGRNSICANKTLESITIISETNETAHRHVQVYKEELQWITIKQKTKETDGYLSVIQFNLPEMAKNRQPLPLYPGKKTAVKNCTEVTGRTSITVISGEWQGIEGLPSDIQLALLYLQPFSRVQLRIAPERNMIVYVIQGSVIINNERITGTNLVLLDNKGAEICIGTEEETIILAGHALPVDQQADLSGTFVGSAAEEQLI